MSGGPTATSAAAVRVAHPRATLHPEGSHSRWAWRRNRRRALLQVFYALALGAASSVVTAWCGLPLASKTISGRHHVGLRWQHLRKGSRRYALPQVKLGSEIELWWEEDGRWRPAVVERLYGDGKISVCFGKDGYEYHCIPDTWRMRLQRQESASADVPCIAAASPEPEHPREAPEKQSADTEEPPPVAAALEPPAPVVLEPEFGTARAESSESSSAPEPSKVPEPPSAAIPVVLEEDSAEGTNPDESPPLAAPQVPDPSPERQTRVSLLEEAMSSLRERAHPPTPTPTPTPEESPAAASLEQVSASTEESPPIAATLEPDLAGARSESSFASQSKRPEPQPVAAPVLLEAPSVSLEGFKVGQKLRGRIRKLEVYGAFVDVGHGFQGLVHVSGMSTTWSGKSSSGIVLMERQEVDVWVRDVDHKRLRLGLALFNLWGFDAIAGKPGSWLSGTITSVDAHTICVQAQLDNGDQATGVVPVTEVETGYVADPSAEYQLGQEVRVRVLRADFAKFTLYFSMRPMVEALALQSLPADTWLNATVTRVTKYGMSVDAELDSSAGPDSKVSGLVHIREFRPRGAGDSISEVQVGQQVQVRVLSVDTKAGRVAFTMLEGFDWSPFEACTDWIPGTVTRREEYGLFVSVRPPGAADAIEGLVAKSKIKEDAAVGDTVQIRIKRVDKKGGKLQLAMRAKHTQRAPAAAASANVEKNWLQVEKEWLQATVTKVSEERLEVSVRHPDHAEPVAGVIPREEIRRGVVARAKDEAEVGDAVTVRVLHEDDASGRRLVCSMKAGIDLSGFVTAAQQGQILGGTVSEITPSHVTVIVPSPNGGMGAEGIVPAAKKPGAARVGDAAIGQLVRVRVVRVMEDAGRLELRMVP